MAVDDHDVLSAAQHYVGTWYRPDLPLKLVVYTQSEEPEETRGRRQVQISRGVRCSCLCASPLQYQSGPTSVSTPREWR